MNHKLNACNSIYLIVYRNAFTDVLIVVPKAVIAAAVVAVAAVVVVVVVVTFCRVLIRES